MSLNTQYSLPKPDRPRFAFLGSPPFAATILRRLLLADWRPSLVVTEPAKPAARGQRLRSTAVAELATERSLSVVTPTASSELLSSLSQLNSLDLLIVAAYGRILRPEVLALPRHGAVNVHASLLPKYRGASPVQAAILAGDTETGVTFMVMEPTLDTGPIISQVPVTLVGTETATELTARLADVAGQSIVLALKQYLLGNLRPMPQDETQASSAPKLTKEDGRVDLLAVDPNRLDRLVRAYTPWPGVYTDQLSQGKSLDGARDKRLRIVEGKLEPGGRAYRITRLGWAGKPLVDGASLTRANPELLTALPPTIRLAAS